MGLQPVTIPGVLRVEDDRQRLDPWERPRTMGVWGGSVEYDRRRLAHLSIDEAVRVLEETFPARLDARTAAWRATMRDRLRRRRDEGKRGGVGRRDQRIAAKLGLTMADLVAGACARCGGSLVGKRADAIYCRPGCRSNAFKAAQRRAAYRARAA